MFQAKLLFASLAVFSIAVSVPAEEEIEPVEMAYTYIKADAGAESEAKSPILLLHGVGGSKKLWNGMDQFLANETKRSVYAVDFRNHGDSPWNDRGDVEALAVDVGHFLDQQGIKKINFIGQSLGGKTAIHYALKNPDRVDSLVTEDISPNSLPSDAIMMVSFMFKILKAALRSIPEGATQDEAQKTILNFINKKFEELGSSERLPEHFSDFLELKMVEGEWRFKFNIDLIEEIVKEPEKHATESKGLYEGPTLFIYGTKSPFKVYEDKENILKLFPNAQFVPVEGAGHIIHGIYHEFEDAIVPFLNKVN